MITTEQTPTLADCRWPSEFPRFVIDQVDQGVPLDQLLDKPWKWDVEFQRFISGVNCDVIRKSQTIEDWLDDVTFVSERRASGGSRERAIEYSDWELGPAQTGKVGNLVADFTDYPDADVIETGGKFRFTTRSVPHAAGDLSQRVTIEATAYPERKHGRLIVVWELEAVR